MTGRRSGPKIFQLFPLIVAADISDDIRIYRHDRGVNGNPGVLDTGQQPPGLIRIQGIIEFENRSECRRGQRASGTDCVSVDCSAMVGIDPPFC